MASFDAYLVDEMAQSLWFSRRSGYTYWQYRAAFGRMARQRGNASITELWSPEPGSAEAQWRMPVHRLAVYPRRKRRWLWYLAHPDRPEQNGLDSHMFLAERMTNPQSKLGRLFARYGIGLDLIVASPEFMAANGPLPNTSDPEQLLDAYTMTCRRPPKRVDNPEWCFTFREDVLKAPPQLGVERYFDELDDQGASLLGSHHPHGASLWTGNHHYVMGKTVPLLSAHLPGDGRPAFGWGEGGGLGSSPDGGHVFRMRRFLPDAERTSGLEFLAWRSADARFCSSLCEPVWLRPTDRRLFSVDQRMTEHEAIAKSNEVVEPLVRLFVRASRIARQKLADSPTARSNLDVRITADLDEMTKWITRHDVDPSDEVNVSYDLAYGRPLTFSRSAGVAIRAVRDADPDLARKIDQERRRINQFCLSGSTTYQISLPAESSYQQLLTGLRYFEENLRARDIHTSPRHLESGQANMAIVNERLRLHGYQTLDTFGLAN